MEVPFHALNTLAGTDLGSTDWMLVEQSRVYGFADATDDHQWIHVDPVRAAEGPFGSTIAHGYLTLALVNVGARIRGAGEVVSVEEVKGGLQLVVRVSVEIEGADRPACVVDTISRFYP